MRSPAFLFRTAPSSSFLCGCSTFFSGVKNACSAVCNARIQGIYDLVSKKFVAFSIDPYSRNDMSAALDIDVEPDDLLLRDRGYFTVENARKLKEKGADTISRYKHKTNIYNVETGEEINLLEYLGKYGSSRRRRNGQFKKDEGQKGIEQQKTVQGAARVDVLDCFCHDR